MMRGGHGDGLDDDGEDDEQAEAGKPVEDDVASGPVAQVGVQVGFEVGVWCGFGVGFFIHGGPV